MRINKFLAACGLGSRRKVEEIVRAGRVTLNGAVVLDLSTFVDRGQDRVTVDGRPVTLPGQFTYYLLHKPEGVVTTSSDPERRSTVQELVPARPRVFPVGRLDRDTSGALLLTDDGTLAHRILHPRYGVEKEYIAVVEGTISDAAVLALQNGVRLEGERRPTAPAAVQVIERKTRRSRLRLIIHEGRNRQVRRMLDAVGFPVIQLRRQRIGPVALGNLAEGLYRRLTDAEVLQLRLTVRGESRHVRRAPARRPHAPRTAAPRTAAPRRAAPRTAAPRTTAPRKAAPRKAAPRKAAPRKAPAR